MKKFLVLYLAPVSSQRRLEENRRPRRGKQAEEKMQAE
jgi:hypothetical protein